MRAAEKVETIRQDLGKVGTVIAEQVEEAMLGRRRRLETQESEREAGTARQQLKFERNVSERVQRLRERLGQTRTDLRLDPRNVLTAVETALELADLPPLTTASLPGANGSAFRLPDLRGSWSRCAEGLQDAVTHRVRPITFDHEVAGDRTDVVLAHLNHPLVQMSLRLLRAEIWAAEDRKKLHRITARSVPQEALPGPALIVHGRLIVVGSSHQRLHEELVAAGGSYSGSRWERHTQGAIESLLGSAGDTLPTLDEPKLFDLVQENSEKLLSSLNSRINERFTSIQRELEQRRDRDLADIESVMTELADSIRANLEATSGEKQMFLPGMTPEERDQLERNQESLRRRLECIPADLAKEQESIRARYQDPDPRSFPLAVTVLVPEGWRHG